MGDTIEIYKNNSKTIIRTITDLDSITGYTAVLTVKHSLEEDVVISSTGSTDGLTVTFTLLPADTDIEPDSYIYDIVLSNTTNNYTVIQAALTVLDSVKYN